VSNTSNSVELFSAAPSTLLSTSIRNFSAIYGSSLEVPIGQVANDDYEERVHLTIHSSSTTRTFHRVEISDSSADKDVLGFFFFSFFFFYFSFSILTKSPHFLPSAVGLQHQWSFLFSYYVHFR
jgi:hypothetical protein